MLLNTITPALYYYTGNITTEKQDWTAFSTTLLIVLWSFLKPQPLKNQLLRITQMDSWPSQDSAHCTLWQPNPCAHLDDSLTGGERQPHQAGVVDWHDLVTDAELPRTGGRASIHHVGQDDGGQNRAPARLHNNYAQNLPLLLLQLQLWQEKERERETEA